MGPLRAPAQLHDSARATRCNGTWHACSESFWPGCRGWQVALHIARGLHHMHSRKVMHLDLKSANILLARDGTAKVADVGLAKILTRDNTHVSMEGTFDWAAPEVSPSPHPHQNSIDMFQGSNSPVLLACVMANLVYMLPYSHDLQQPWREPARIASKSERITCTPSAHLPDSRTPGHKVMGSA